MSSILESPSKSSDDIRNGEFGRLADEDIASMTTCVVGLAFTGDVESAKGGRRKIVVGRVEDMEERTDAVRRLMLIAGVPLAGLAVTLTLEVEARGEVLATSRDEGRCRGDGFGDSRGVRRSCVGGDMDDAG
jgi:hypothetical protein